MLLLSLPLRRFSAAASYDATYFATFFLFMLSAFADMPCLRHAAAADIDMPRYAAEFSLRRRDA